MEIPGLEIRRVKFLQEKWFKKSYLQLVRFCLGK